MRRAARRMSLPTVAAVLLIFIATPLLNQTSSLKRFHKRDTESIQSAQFYSPKVNIQRTYLRPFHFDGIWELPNNKAVSRHAIKAHFRNTVCPGVNSTLLNALLSTNHSRETVVLVHLNLDSSRLYQFHGMGTGNWIGFLYSIRFASGVVGQATVNVTVVDAVEQQTQLVLPWLAGEFAPLHLPSSVDRQEACGDFHELPYLSILSVIRDDLRRLALVAVTGRNVEGHLPLSHGLHSDAIRRYQKRLDMLPTTHGVFYQLPLPREPLHPNIELDEAAIHFRCGDVVLIGHARYGFLPFRALADVIKSNVKSIGIVTQSFNDTDNRRKDKLGTSRCELLVETLQHYLQRRFPTARVKIRNDSNETMITSLARLLLANQTLLAAISTFSLFAILASFGTGYLPEPPNPETWKFMWQEQEQPASPLDRPIVLLRNQSWFPSLELSRMLAEPSNVSKVLQWLEQ